MTPGQYANFSVLSADYFAVPEEEIRNIESALSVVVVYGVGDFASLAPPLPPPIGPAWSSVSTYGGYYSFTR